MQMASDASLVLVLVTYTMKGGLELPTLRPINETCTFFFIELLHPLAKGSILRTGL